MPNFVGPKVVTDLKKGLYSPLRRFTYQTCVSCFFKKLCKMLKTLLCIKFSFDLKVYKLYNIGQKTFDAFKRFLPNSCILSNITCHACGRRAS